MRSLIIGGTRNLGPSIVQALLQESHEITIFNRGQTPDDLPVQVERLRGDRGDPQQLQAALRGRSFDVVIDTTLYSGAEAEAAVNVFRDRVGRYIFISTGQVYLVRVGVQRPFKETDYPGPVMPEPAKADESDHSNWLYGFDKRQAEDVFADAWSKHKFPFTSLRLPMVNSERDHYDRIYGYFLRLRDGGPILVPEDVPDEVHNHGGAPIRHVYGDDVVQAILRIITTGKGRGECYNIGQDESVSLRQFLEMMAGLMKAPLKLKPAPRVALMQASLLPGCSPFSDLWMSALDNIRSKTELGMRYTPLEVYLKKLVAFYAATSPREIEAYRQRARELHFAAAI
jgi:nucleoside-diphosphate-sugar epimerase